MSNLNVLIDDIYVFPEYIYRPIKQTGNEVKKPSTSWLSCHSATCGGIAEIVSGRDLQDNLGYRLLCSKSCGARVMPAFLVKF